MHAKRWGGTDLEAENKKEDDDGEGVLASLSMLSSVSALSPLFSVGVRLLSFISAFSSLSLYWFSSSVLPCSAEHGAETERQSLLVLAFDNLKKT